MEKEQKRSILGLGVIVTIILLLGTLSAGCFGDDDNGDDGNDGSGTTGITISANKADRNIYYSVEIVKVSGGPLNIEDAKFLIVTNAGVQKVKKAYTDANPSSITSSDTTVYPIPSGSGACTENATNGDGATADTTTVDNPTWFEDCYFVIIDSESDGKINSGDAFYIYKDYNDDGTDDISSGYKFKIQDAEGTAILIKEL